MGNSNLINQVIVLFLTMIVGYIARKRNIITDQLNKGLTELLVSITLPFMIIASFNYSFSMDMLIKALFVFSISFIIHIVLALAGWPLYRMFPKNIRSVLRFITIFSNCGFMGYPVVESVYGKVGVFYAAIYNIPFNIFLWTLGVMLFTGKSDKKTLKKAILNPGIISVIIGIGLFLFSIKLPEPVYKTLNMIGSTTTPISMLVIGSMLANMNVKDIFTGFPLYYGALIRLIVVPFAVLFVLKVSGMEGMMLGIPVLLAAMPAAANTAIVSEKYGGDSDFASRCVFVTTILSVLTISLVIQFL